MCYNVHDHLKEKNVEELKTISGYDRLNFSVCLLNLEHDLNIGNCIRSAHLMGAEKVFILGNKKYDSRSTVGAHNYTDVIKIQVKNIEDDLEVAGTFETMCTLFKLIPIIIEKTDNSVNITEIYDRFNNRSYENWVDSFDIPESRTHFCLVVGNEGKGIPKAILDYNYPVFHINQRGVIRSLNVSSAAAIAMHELTRYNYVPLKLKEYKEWR